MKPRLYLHVVFDAAQKLWQVKRANRSRMARAERGAMPIRQEPTKSLVLAWARIYGRECWDVHQQPVQLVIHNRNGRFQPDATYGADPRKSKG